MSDDTPPSEWLYGEGYPNDSLSLPVEWWRVFGDTTLNTLITTALNNNREVEATATKVLAAQAELRVVRAEYLPSLSLEAYGERLHNQLEGVYSEYYVEPTISWELSLFGAMRESKRSARADIIASRWALNAVLLSVAAEVATTYFTLCQAATNLEIARLSQSLRGEEARLIDSLYHYGLSDGVALQQARSLLYSATADVESYQRAVNQTHLSLCTLIGENPTLTVAYTSMGNIPLKTPIGLPSELVERRPDIQQSYYQMAAAAADVGIARASRYPSITLSAGGGVLSSSVKGLMQGDPWAWSLAGEIVAPLFNFGKLKNQERRAKAEYMEALYSYEQTMLVAFAEVEQALVAVSSYAAEREAMVDLVEANAIISHTVGALYDSGMNDYLNVIDAERELYSSQMDLSNIIAEHYISYVTLFKALGGGY